MTETPEVEIPEVEIPEVVSFDKVCKHWENGLCKFSFKCRFLHPGAPPADVADPPVPCARARAQWPSRKEARWWMHLFLHQRHTGFQLVPMLIGTQGVNMKEIHIQTGSKIRIRGRGSGHLEVDGMEEAPVPLMAAVTTDRDQPEMFLLAVHMTIKLLHEVQTKWRAFCHDSGCPSV